MNTKRRCDIQVTIMAAGVLLAIATLSGAFCYLVGRLAHAVKKHTQKTEDRKLVYYHVPFSQLKLH